MPPCPTSPPPALALVSPWQAPGYYVIVLCLAIPAGVIVWRAYTTAGKPLTRRARIGFVSCITGVAVIVAAFGGLFLVLEPSVNHIVAWQSTQVTRFGPQVCSLAVQQALTGRLLRTWDAAEIAAVVVTLCGMAVLGVGARIIRPAIQRRTP